MNYIAKDKTIIFSPYFNKEIEPGLLEKYHNVIFSNYELNEDLFECYEKNDFKNFKKIYSKFNQQVNLPHNLTNLTFGLQFNQQVNLPPNLTHLTLGLQFNQQVNLPPNLTHLTFGLQFNQQVNLPFNVQFLELHRNNKNIIDYLPDSVEELVLGYYFNLELNNLPSSMKKLIINYNNYNHELNCLPNNLEYLALPFNYDKEIKKYPKQLKTIKCNADYEYIDKVKQNGFKIETYS